MLLKQADKPKIQKPETSQDPQMKTSHTPFRKNYGNREEKHIDQLHDSASKEVTVNSASNAQSWQLRIYISKNFTT